LQHCIASLKFYSSHSGPSPRLKILLASSCTDWYKPAVGCPRNHARHALFPHRCASKSHSAKVKQTFRPGHRAMLLVLL